MAYKVVGGIFYTGGIFYITLFSKYLQFAACRGLKLVTNISARKPNAHSDFVVTVVTTSARSSESPQSKEHVRCGHHKRATAFRFKRSEPTCMNGTSVKITLPFNQPSRTFAVADVQRKWALTSLFLALCVLPMVDFTSQPPITPIIATSSRQYVHCIFNTPYHLMIKHMK